MCGVSQAHIVALIYQKGQQKGIVIIHAHSDPVMSNWIVETHCMSMAFVTIKSHTRRPPEAKHCILYLCLPLWGTSFTELSNTLMPVGYSFSYSLILAVIASNASYSLASFYSALKTNSTEPVVQK